MVFHCPRCNNTICTGLRKDFIVIHKDGSLAGILPCQCPKCNYTHRLYIEGSISKITPLE